MKGFDSQYANFPDWINGITHEIWEERGIDKLLYLYSDCLLYTSPSPRDRTRSRMPSSA